MAHLYSRKGSPFWWIKARDSKPGSATFGRTIRFSTGLRVGRARDKREADQIRAEYTLGETLTRVDAHTHPWDSWVLPYLRGRAKTALTLARRHTQWRNLSMFFFERSITNPRQVTRELCLDYLDWRAKPDKRSGKYSCCHNTALDELGLLSTLMDEAVSRGYATVNLAKRLQVARHPKAVKPEYTDAQIEIISSAIAALPDGPDKTILRNSFLIAKYQGCRQAETYLNPQTDVDLAPDGKSGVIRFVIKGGRFHAAPLHPALLPLFQQLKASGASETYPRPPHLGSRWHHFLDTLRDKLPPRACFHSIRVTAITRLARSGVTESKAMKFIGHAGITVHRTYQRLRVDDLTDCLAALADKRPTSESPDASAATGVVAPGKSDTP